MHALRYTNEHKTELSIILMVRTPLYIPHITHIHNGQQKNM